MRSETELPAVLVERESRFEALFDAPGILDVSRFFGGRYPIMSGGTVFELWASLRTPADTLLTVVLIHLRSSAPAIESGVMVHSLDVNPGAYIASARFEHRVQRGDQLAVGVNVTGTPGTPGTDMTMLARIA